MSEVVVSGLTKSFGPIPVLKEVSFTARAGKFITLLGPSGCGKTTSLRCIAGFEETDAGEITLDGQSLVHVPPWRRGLGVVFQSYALFPFMNVGDNLAFGLRRRGVPASEIERKVTQALDLVSLPNMQARFPRQLSGGQQQRVALARALIISPSVLLLDEPLSNLDAKLRAEMRLELKRIQNETGVTTILVTHDQDEALTMSDHIVVMNAGRVMASGSPKQVWENPGDRFVADFLGVENLLAAAPGSASPQAIIGFRSADASLSRDAGANSSEKLVYSGAVLDAVYRGSFLTCRVKANDGSLIVAQCASDFSPLPGEKVSVEVRRDKMMLLNSEPK